MDPTPISYRAVLTTIRPVPGRPQVQAFCHCLESAEAWAATVLSNPSRSPGDAVVIYAVYERTLETVRKAAPDVPVDKRLTWEWAAAPDAPGAPQGHATPQDGPRGSQTPQEPSQ